MGISYERLQALAFCTSLIPILKKLYKDPEELKIALKRHLVFFNTEAVYGAIINGITIAMEQQRANGEDISDEAITGMKTGLMGPMAGIGDTIDWATLKPIIFGMAASLSATGNPMGCFVLLLLPLIQVIVGSKLAVFGYRAGKESIRTILKSGRVNELIMAASTLGLFMMGALSSTYIKLSTPLQVVLSSETEPFVLQNVFDGFVPGLLPLAAVMGIYWWLKNKNQNFAIMTVMILVVSILGSLIGIL
jgi:D-glucosaminate-specific PTS system IID component